MYAWLSTTPANVSAVGLDAKGSPRVYPGTAPIQADFPHETFEIISDLDASGGLDGPGGVWRARIQIDCWGQGQAGYDDIQAMGQAVLQLHGYLGTLAGIRIQRAWLIPPGASDSSTAPDDGSDNAIHQKSLDFMIHYERA